MRALKIKNTPDGLRLARCLVGSCQENEMKLVGIDEQSKSPFMLVHTSLESIFPSTAEEIILPLSTLKLCPFVAMREGITVISFAYEIEDTMSGEIVSISTDRLDKSLSSIIMYNGDWFRCKDVSDITLDIEAACRLDGVEEVTA